MAVWAYSTTRLGLGGTPISARLSEINRSLRAVVISAAAGETGIKGVVFSEPTGSDLVGTKIGEFAGEAFEVTLESSDAVIYVDTRAFGGQYLDTTRTPKVILQGTTGSPVKTTGILASTIVKV